MKDTAFVEHVRSDNKLVFIVELIQKFNEMWVLL